MATTSPAMWWALNMVLFSSNIAESLGDPVLSTLVMKTVRFWGTEAEKGGNRWASKISSQEVIIKMGINVRVFPPWWCQTNTLTENLSSSPNPVKGAVPGGPYSTAPIPRWRYLCMEKEMAAHSSTLARIRLGEIPMRKKKPGRTIRLQSKCDPEWKQEAGCMEPCLSAAYCKGGLARF